MKKSNLFILLLITLFFSCKSNGNADVENSVKNFFEGMYDRNFDKARANATAESEEVISMLESLANAAPADTQEKKPTISIRDVQIENDTLATASVKAEDQPNEIRMSLKKRNGNWKVAFDLRSLATMLGQNPDEAEEDMMAPPNDSLDINFQKALPQIDSI